MEGYQNENVYRMYQLDYTASPFVMKNMSIKRGTHEKSYSIYSNNARFGIAS